MEVITATELLQKRAVKNRLAEFDTILEIVEMASGVSREDIRFDIDTMFGVCLRINIDEWFFDIDGKSFEDWCMQNCEGDFNSDKWFRIDSLKAVPTCDADFAAMRKLEAKEVE